MTDWTGEPVSGATVTAIQDDVIVAGALTDENGYYSLPLPQGSYRLMATSDGYGQVSLDIEVTEPVTVEFELIRKDSIYGVVTDRNGNPLQDMLVEVLDSDYNLITDTLTGAGGRYQVDLEGYLDDEPLTLIVMFSGDMVFDEEETVIMNSGDSLRVDREMERITILMGAVRGSETVASGIPLNIYYEDLEGGGGFTVFTDDSGLYFIEVPEDIAGAVTAAGVNDYGYMEYMENITLTPFTINTLNIELQERAVLHVTAVNMDGDTLDNVLFSVSNGDVCREAPALYGKASFAVEEGEVLLRALRALYSTYQDTINITARRTEITVILSRPGLPSGVEGHVTDRRTGEAIPYAEVNLHHGTGDGSFNLYTYTDEDGYYSFSHQDHPLLVSGIPCELYVYREGYRVYSRQFTLPEGTVECDAELEHLTILTGRVLDPDGKIIYTHVTLSWMVDGSLYESTVMNDESGYYGFYDISESDDGLYTLSAEDWRYRPFNETLPLNASEYNHHDIIMGFYDGYLKVNITDRNGEPVQGVMVTLQGPGTLDGMSGADGTVEFMHLARHEWLLTASHPDYVPINRTVMIDDGDSEYLTLELTRKGCPIIFQGHVYGADQTPLPGVRILFWPSNQTWTTIYTTTDSNGFYNLSTGSFPAMVSGLTGCLRPMYPIRGTPRPG